MKILILYDKNLTLNHFNKTEVEESNNCVRRTFTDILSGIYHDLFEDYNDELVFVEKCNTKSDSLLKDWCKSNNLFYENYSINGKLAESIINDEMISKCDYCLAFPIIGSNNKEVSNLIDKCNLLDKHVDIYSMEM